MAPETGKKAEPSSATATSPITSKEAELRRFWRRILILYLAGTVFDIAWHVGLDLTTGDRQIEVYEWLDGLQASLFWPIDLVAQIVLALR